MIIYVTKYALTTGISKHEADIHKDGNMAVTKRVCQSYSMCLHGEGKEWHRTREAALNRAEEMRIKKLQSLDKQHKKISALKFYI